MTWEISLRGVSKTYGPVRALTGVDAVFTGGHVTAIEGPNGAGKSTLLSIVGTLSRPTSGKVSHGALGRTPAAVRARLGWLGHESLSYGDLSGRENVRLAATLHGMSPDEAMRAAEARFDLKSFADRPLRTYSRGQRQRVALARALVHAPDLILLDEPTAGLDARSTSRLLDVLREEAARGAVVVVVTHDPVLSALAEARLHLERGRHVGAKEA